MVASVRAIVEKALARPVPNEVRLLADAAVAEVGGHGVLAVLFYGSCFRSGDTSQGLVDLYLLVENYACVHGSRLMRLANRLVPPNVYYLQREIDGRTLRAKFALVSFEQFEELVGAGARNPYFWARFAQPTGVVQIEAGWRERLIACFERAIVAFYAHACELRRRYADEADGGSRELWITALQATYRTELRAEKPFRAAEIYENDRERFDAIHRLLAHAELPTPNAASWRCRRFEGKLLSVARLIKAAFTFVGGADYLVWKIERHTGFTIELEDWQRRHPVLAAGPIVLRLWRARVIR